MRTFGRPVLAAALALVLTLGVSGMAHADEETPVEPVATSAPADPAPLASATDTSAATDEPPADEPPADDPPPTEPVDDNVLTVDNAQFRWGFNPLLHQAPHFGQNFMTAGVLADTGGGMMPASRWKQSEGAVSIVRASGTKYVPATWATFGTGADHQVVINGGKGTVDLAAGTATIAWTGRFGVARYSGMTGFTVSNPQLIIEGGKGRLEATMDGFGISRDGNGSGDASGPLATETVVLADFGAVTLTRKGFTVTPTFYGVRVDHAQQRTDTQGRWGSFPAPFIRFVDQVGQAEFWMTSGSDDDASAPSPVTISFNAKDAVVVPPPKTTDKTPKPIVNKTKKAPKPQPRVQQTAPSAPTGFVPPSVPPVVDVPVQTVAFTPTTASSLTGLPPAVAGTSREPTLAWWLAATFLLLAAVAAALPGFIARSRAS